MRCPLPQWGWSAIMGAGCSGDVGVSSSRRRERDRASPSICLNCCSSSAQSGLGSLGKQSDFRRKKESRPHTHSQTLYSNDAQLTYPPSRSLSNFFCPFLPSLLPSRIWHSLTLELTSIYPDPIDDLPLLFFARFLNSFVRGETN